MNYTIRRVATCLLSALWATTTQAQVETIVVDGSTGVMPLVEALARAYRDQNPGTVIEIGQGLGTKARIDALSAGKIDIAMASHGLDIAGIQRLGMAVHEIGKVAVVFGVNAGVVLSDITENDICDIYSSRIKNWKQVGGADLAVVPLTRPESEVDTEVVRDKIGCLKTLKMPEHVKVMPKGPDMARELATTTGAVGMTTTTVIEQSQGRVKALSVAGVAPTPQNVQNKKYVLTRDSFLVTRAAPTPGVARFLEFVRSSSGEKVIRANGAIPAR